jgi:hypothetical protein
MHSSLDPTAWPIGARVRFWDDRTDPKPGVIVGHTPKTVRIRPDGWTSYVNRIPENVRLTEAVASTTNEEQLPWRCLMSRRRDDCSEKLSRSLGYWARIVRRRLSSASRTPVTRTNPYEARSARRTRRDSPADVLAALADPPYPGQSKKHYADHPDYAGEVDHAELVERLESATTTAGCCTRRRGAEGRAAALPARARG